MITVPSDSPRWQDYLISRGDETSRFWSGLMRERKRSILYILGQGFDPRMCLGLEMLVANAGESAISVLLIERDEGNDSPSEQHRELADRNTERLKSLEKHVVGSNHTSVPMRSPDGRHIGARRVAAVFDSLGLLSDATDIVVDVSALPRHTFYPIISKLLTLLDRKTDWPNCRAPNLHVIIAENASTDSQILEADIADSAEYLHGYSSELQSAANDSLPIIWIPILGEKKSEQLRSVYRLVEPDEICPVIPWPSRDPRRGDSIVAEYHSLLFDTFRIEPRNIIYASETNPFQAYRQIYNSATHYALALASLGGCKLVVSAISSKLLSLGALLAAYELKQKAYKVGIAHVESVGYQIAEGVELADNAELCSMWLCGECYEE